MPTTRFRLSNSMIVFMMMALLATVNYFRSIHVGNRVAKPTSNAPDVLFAQEGQWDDYSEGEEYQYGEYDPKLIRDFKLGRFEDMQLVNSKILGSFATDNDKIYADGYLHHKPSLSFNISDPSIEDWKRQSLVRKNLQAKMVIDNEGLDSSSLVKDRQNRAHLMKSYGGIVHVANYAVFNAAMEVAAQLYPNFYDGDNLLVAHREMALPKLVAVEIAKYDSNSLYSIGVAQPKMDSLTSFARYSKNNHSLLSESDDRIAHLVKVIGGAIGISDLTERNIMKTTEGGFAVPDVGNCVVPGVILGSESENVKDVSFLRGVLSSPAVAAAIDFKSSLLSIQNPSMFAAYNERAGSIKLNASNLELSDEGFSKINPYDESMQTHDLESVLVHVDYDGGLNPIPKSGMSGSLGLVGYVNIFKAYEENSLAAAMDQAEHEYQKFTAQMSKIADGRQIPAPDIDDNYYDDLQFDQTPDKGFANSPSASLSPYGDRQAVKYSRDRGVF